MSSSNLNAPTSMPEELFNLDAIAHYNAHTQSPAYFSNSHAAHDYYYEPAQNQHELNQPLDTPDTRSATPASGSLRTRRTRPARTTSSPYNTSQPRDSKSPAAGVTPKRNRKAKPGKTTAPRITTPLSVLTRDMSTPLRDIEAWVNRPAQVRQAEADKRGGYITRPMNSFMLYRSCYADRTKQWCLQNNHQVVSSVSGESWPMESDEVRKQFEEWAKIERANHHAAHPDYKFTPAKTPAAKRRKAKMDDDDSGGEDLDADPDGTYREPNRSRSRPRQQQLADTRSGSPASGDQAQPYYGHLRVEHEGWPNYGSPPLGWHRVSFDRNFQPWDMETGQYIPLMEAPVLRTVPSERLSGAFLSSSSQNPALGAYGLPTSQQLAEEYRNLSRHSTSAKPHDPFDPSYIPGQPVRATIQSHHSNTQTPYDAAQHQLYEHQQYMRNTMQPQTVIDPNLDAAQRASQGYHGQADPWHEMHDHLEHGTDTDQTLALPWLPSRDLSS